MRDAANIRLLDELQLADWMGFIFYSPSSRHVSDVPSYMPQYSQRVGVFVNYSIIDIAARVQEFGFNIVQLHGNESPGFCQQLREVLPQGTQLMKMIQIASPEDLNHTSLYENSVDYFLFETKCTSYGGSGKQFDWDILQEYSGNTPFILTGGIGPDDAAKIKSFQHPLFAGIDLNSKFEITPAFKDINILKNFITQLR